MARSEVIRIATSTEDFAAFAALIQEYVAWSKERWSDKAPLVDEFYSQDELHQELAELPAAFAPPDGVVLLALEGEAVLGCAAFRRFDATRCELKRVFVPTRHQGRGIGRKLCEALLEHAKARNYAGVRLDTDIRSFEAIGLYHALGFEDCAPYADYPTRFLPYAVFMELNLVGA